MKAKNDPITPREFISSFRDMVGDAYLIKLFKLSTHPESGRRSLNHWTAQLPYVDEDSIRENWIEKHERLMKRLMLQPGGLDIVRDLVARHADMVDCDLISSIHTRTGQDDHRRRMPGRLSGPGSFPQCHQAEKTPASRQASFGKDQTGA